MQGFAAGMRCEWEFESEPVAGMSSNAHVTSWFSTRDRKSLKGPSVFLSAVGVKDSSGQTRPLSVSKSIRLNTKVRESDSESPLSLDLTLSSGS